MKPDVLVFSFLLAGMLGQHPKAANDNRSGSSPPRPLPFARGRLSRPVSRRLERDRDVEPEGDGDPLQRGQRDVLSGLDAAHVLNGYVEKFGKRFLGDLPLAT